MDLQLPAWARWDTACLRRWGVQVALPDETVICISGDASFQMNLQELGTLAQYGIAVKTVIINNGWQGHGASSGSKPSYGEAIFLIQYAEWVCPDF